MNLTNIKTILLLGVAGCSGSAFATVTTTEDFNSYTVGSAIGGLNGGTGWTSAWSANSATITQVTAGDNQASRGSFNSMSRTFTSLGTTGFAIYTWAETAGGLLNNNRRAFLQDSAGTNVIAVQNRTVTTSAGASVALSGTETTGVAIALNYTTGQGSLAFLPNLTDLTWSSDTGLLSSAGTNTYATFNFDSTKSITNILLTDSTVRGVDNIKFATDGASLGFTVIPEPSTYGLLGAGTLAGLAVIRRRRSAR